VSHLVEFSLEDGGSLYVEVDDAPSAGPTVRGRASPGAVVSQAGATLEHVLGGVGPMLAGLVDRMRAAASPTSVEVEFSIKLTADAHLVVARSGGEANFRVTARWSPEGA
jgi:hypothetical protein